MSSETASKPEKNKYKATLNLPKTAFPMRANLLQNEPATRKRWAKLGDQKEGLYAKLREREHPKGRFVFHDGPPYANGSLHLGHLMNKCLKDFVVRSKSMMGYDVPYVPGWDCHGLPIEHKVMQGLVESGKAQKLAELPDETRKMAVRRECEASAKKAVKLQSGQMEQMLTLADYDKPYLTMQKPYERAVLEVLAGLLSKGLVYRALKPVHWSIDNVTALADAELEYEDREDVSVFVDFESADADAVYAAFGLDEAARDEKELHARPSFMIWTTTPWTLPANVAVAVNPDFEYALVKLDGNLSVLAKELVEKVAEQGGVEVPEILATTSGEKLVGLAYRHPFRSEDETPEVFAGKRYFEVVPAAYVTLDDGTGLVHTAPGHGAEDFMTGGQQNLPTYCPVLGDGSYDGTVPEWLSGKHIWKANDEIVARLRESGHLFHGTKFWHSYPHDWRSKTPVIFRCTEQWFVTVDSGFDGGASLKERALSVTQKEGGARFVPEWGRNRMRGMLESRPDWCISRQRAWGLPIPAFVLPDGSSFMTEASCRAVAKAFREEGSDSWFEKDAEHLLRHWDRAGDPECPEELRGDASLADLKKGGDILDVWFESGSSWNAVMRERSGGADFPVDLYLEGSDQHRGWFQLSLLPALGVMGEPPFKTLLTHGFMVGKDGRKLSKSSGDTVEGLLKDYGADVMRWWVSSLSYENDVKVDREFYDQAGESYRKVRNTVRFLLSNLDDFEVSEHGVQLSSIPPTSIDAWALSAYDAMAAKVVGAYDAYHFGAAHKALYDFCNDAMSSVYLAAVKDRMYCDPVDGERRRRTQTVMYKIAEGLCTLLAPVLAHTADEAWRVLKGVDQKDAATCVHLETFRTSFGVAADGAWPKVMAARDAGLMALEKARAASDLDNPLDAGVVLPDLEGVLARFDAVDLADLMGVSEVRLDGSATEASTVDLRDRARCERSWKRDGTVAERSDGGLLSDRDAAAVGVA